MADKPLKSLRFPGLDDTYTIPAIDNTLSVSGAAADAAAVGAALAGKASNEAVYDVYPEDVASGAIASFPDGAGDVPVKDLTIGIKAAQSGSGDPSRTNVRPISGWTGANIVVSPTEDAQDGTTYSVSWTNEAGTVYGGTLDVTTGVLTVDMVLVHLDSEDVSWSLRAAGYFRGTISGLTLSGSSTGFDCPCSCYPTFYPASGNTSSIPDKTYLCAWNNVGQYMVIKDTDYATADALAASLTGQTAVVRLSNATIRTYQLTPQEVETLLGANNIWADTGDTSVEYRADTTLYIQKLTGAEADMIADANIASGKYFMVGNSLYLSTAAIAAGEAIVPGSNCTATNLAAALNALNT